MGNRATVIFADKDWKNLSCVVYLHWNGGPESIYCFLDEMDRREIRINDPSYESARFVHIVGDFFDQDSITGLSLGIWNGPKSMDVADLGEFDSDNGLYVVMRMRNKKIKKYTREVRRFVMTYDKEGHHECMKEMTKADVKKEMRRVRNYKNGSGERYFDSIRKAFLKITGGKKMLGG